jgi:hypothetical protein
LSDILEDSGHSIKRVNFSRNAALMVYSLDWAKEILGIIRNVKNTNPM